MAAYFHLGSLSILWLFLNSRIMEKITMFAAVIMILLSYKTMKGNQNKIKSRELVTFYRSMFGPFSSEPRAEA